MTAPDPHIPDPEVTAPMALAADYVEYRERAHAWIAAQTTRGTLTTWRPRCPRPGPRGRDPR